MANTGHTVDSNTAALWRMDETAHFDYENVAEENGTYGAVQATDSRKPSITGGPGGQGDYARWYRGTADTSLQFSTDATMVAVLLADWTLEGWVYLEDVSSEQCVFSVAGLTSSEASIENYLARLTVTAAGKLSLFWETGGGSNRVVTQVSGTTLVAGTWYYIAVTASEAGGTRTVNFHIDSGASQDSGSDTNATGGGNAFGLFGLEQNNSKDLHGAVSMMRLSSVVRSESEMDANALLHTWANDASTTALWLFQELPELKDIAGPFHAHPGAFTSTPARIADPLIFDGGKARSSEGSKENYTIFAREDLRTIFTSEYTLEFWCRLTDGIATHTIMAWGGSGESNAANFLIRLRIIVVAGEYFVDFFAEAGAGDDVGGIGLVPILVDDDVDPLDARKLHHIGFVFEDAGGGQTLLRAYVDGVQADTIGPYDTPDGGTNPSTTDNGLSMFDTFGGDVDDVRLSNVARSAAEVLASFEAGTPTLVVCPDPEVPSSPILLPGAIPTSTPFGQLRDGDALFFPTADGGDLLFTAGEPTRSGGLRNASYLSMFGANDDDTGLSKDKKSWWGNYLEVDTNRQYRGQTGRLLDTLPLVTSNLPVIAAAVEDDHAWMLETGLATEVSAEVAILDHNKVEITVTINSIGEQSEFEFIENWKAVV